MGPLRTFSLFYPPPSFSLCPNRPPLYPTAPSFSCYVPRPSCAGRRVASKNAVGDVITLVPLQRQRPRSRLEHHNGDDPDRAHRRYDVGASSETIFALVPTARGRLYGMVFFQTYLYFTSGARDRTSLRALVSPPFCCMLRASHFNYRFT